MSNPNDFIPFSGEECKALSCFGGDAFERVSHLLLMDLEFTCWKDSLSSNWSDPSRPPEVVGVGLAAYDLHAERVLGTLHSWVRPKLNPSSRHTAKTCFGCPRDKWIRRCP